MTGPRALSHSNNVHRNIYQMSWQICSLPMRKLTVKAIDAGVSLTNCGQAARKETLIRIRELIR